MHHAIQLQHAEISTKRDHKLTGFNTSNCTAVTQSLTSITLRIKIVCTWWKNLGLSQIPKRVAKNANIECDIRVFDCQSRHEYSNRESYLPSNLTELIRITCVTACSNLAAMRLAIGSVSSDLINVGANTMARFSNVIMFLLFFSTTLKSIKQIE